MRRDGANIRNWPDDHRSAWVQPRAQPFLVRGPPVGAFPRRTGGPHNFLGGWVRGHVGLRESRIPATFRRALYLYVRYSLCDSCNYSLRFLGEHTGCHSEPRPLRELIQNFPQRKNDLKNACIKNYLLNRCKRTRGKPCSRVREAALGKQRLEPAPSVVFARG